MSQQRINIFLWNLSVAELGLILARPDFQENSVSRFNFGPDRLLFIKMASFLAELVSHVTDLEGLDEETATRSVLIHGIPAQVGDEDIIIHFQKGKNGGGEIDHVRIAGDGKAVITFNSCEGLDLFYLYIYIFFCFFFNSEAMERIDEVIICSFVLLPGYLQCPSRVTYHSAKW